MSEELLGARIRQRRLSKNMSLEEVCERTHHVTKFELEGYEEGDVPDTGTVLQLAAALETSADYLFEGLDYQAISLIEIPVCGLPRPDQFMHTEAAQQCQMEIQRYRQIEDILCLNSARPQLPTWVPITNNEPDMSSHWAAELRRHWGLGQHPISVLWLLLEEMGIKVIRVKHYDAFHVVPAFAVCMSDSNGSPPLKIPFLLVNDRFDGPARYVETVRALAYFILRPNMGGAPFANAFLMPDQHFLEEVGHARNRFDLAELMHLATIYWVTPSAVVHRAVDLDVLDMSKANDLVRLVTAPEQPGHWLASVDRAGTPWMPFVSMRFQRLCKRAYSEEIINESKFCELMQCDRTAIPALVEKGHYLGRDGNLVRM